MIITKSKWFKQRRSLLLHWFFESSYIIYIGIRCIIRGGLLKRKSELPLFFSLSQNCFFFPFSQYLRNCRRLFSIKAFIKSRKGFFLFSFDCVVSLFFFFNQNSRPITKVDFFFLPSLLYTFRYVSIENSKLEKYWFAGVPHSLRRAEAYYYFFN